MQVSATLECEARNYRPKWWIRASALGFLAFSLGGLAHFWGSALSGERAPNTTEIIVPALMVLLGFVLTAHFFTASVTLLPNAIEVRTLLSTKKLAFDQIGGRREYEVTDSDGVKTQYIELEPLHRRRPALKLQKIYNFDAAFYDWLRQIPQKGRS